MLGNGKNQEAESGENFNFGKFRKNVSEASEDLVDAVNQIDFSKRGKHAKQDTAELSDSVSTFFTAAADRLATRGQLTADTEDETNNEQTLPAKLLDKTNNLTNTVKGNVKDAKLDKKAADLAGKVSETGVALFGTTANSIKDAKLDKKASKLLGSVSDTWGGLSDNVASTVKDAKLDKKASNLLSSVSDTFSGFSDNVTGTVKDAKLDKKAANLAGNVGDTLTDVAGNVLPIMASVGGVIAEAAGNVVSSVTDAAKDAKLDKKVAGLAGNVGDTFSGLSDSLSSTVKDAQLNKKAGVVAGNVTDLAASLSDSVTGFVKDNKLDKKAAVLAGNVSDTVGNLASNAGENVGSFVKDNKLDEKMFGAFNLIPGVEVKNPKKAAKQFRKSRAQVMKKVAIQQKELAKTLKARRKDAAKYVKARQKDVATGKIAVPFVKVEQKKGFGFPWKTLGGVGLVVGGVAVNNTRIWSNVRPLESKLPGETKYYRSRQGLVFYKEAGQVTGDEHPVVFIHGIGAGAHSYEWLKNIEAVSSLYKTYAYDLLGFGNSERPNFDYTAEVYIKQLTEFLDEVVGTPAYVVASSLSASYAVQVAYRRPELIDKLLLVEPTGLDNSNKTTGPKVVSDAFYGVLRAPIVGKGIYSWVASHTGIRQFMQNQMYYDKSIVTDEMVEQYWISAHQNGAEYAIPSFFTGRLNAEIAKTIGKIDVPVLAVFGKQSRITPPQEAEKVTRENRATRIKVLDKARLSVNWEQAEEFNTLMLDFLDNINQTDVTTESRVHELKVSDIAGAGFVHPGTAQALDDVHSQTGTETPVGEAATEATKSNGNSSKKKQGTYSELNAEPENGQHPQPQG